jgi:tetratricopeptide (TPR) repeat protein
VEGFAVLPDGRQQWLLKIDDWNFNWQSDFRFKRAVAVPKGSRLTMRWTYDNSTNNVRNPNQPPRRVKYGLQSSDEMGELYFQVLPRTATDLATLRDDYQWRVIRDIVAFNTMMLEQNRSNAHAHVQLAKALLALGKQPEALQHLRRAVAIDPKEEEGHYHLGVALMDADAAAAEAEFRRTITINPENFKARGNLGFLLLNSDRLEEAEEQFRAGLRANPGDPLLMENLEIVRGKKNSKIQNPESK